MGDTAILLLIILNPNRDMMGVKGGFMKKLHYLCFHMLISLVFTACTATGNNSDAPLAAKLTGDAGRR